MSDIFTPQGGRAAPSAPAVDPRIAEMLLRRSDSTPAIGTEDIARASTILQRYKDGKTNLENRIVEEEQWWKLRHWEIVRKPGDGSDKNPQPTSAWLFNSIVNKHADAMDNYPEPIVLPREQSDEQTAKTLSSVLPVILESNDFEQTYSDNWWCKLKHGTAAYGVFWNPQKDNGLGSVDIREIDLLKLYWEPGITDIQDSANLFLVELADPEVLDAQYPEHRGKMQGGSIDVKKYLYDDDVDTSNKSVVVDWYYKVRSPDGRTLLHYVKYVGGELLYASENDPQYRQSGWYDDGLYPIVLDCMYPEEGTPAGKGYVAICRDPQLYIDRLGGCILENALQATDPRYFIGANTGVNETEFADKSKRLVHVEGSTLDDTRIKPITSMPLDGIYVSVLQMKIEEMKDTAANRDVNSGGVSSGVTAAAAIAALQEAGNKASRDMIAASYRAHIKINTMCINRMSQFYDEGRYFRITAPNGDYQFVEFSNAGLRDQQIGADTNGVPLYRKPVFDLKIRAQKKNPFSRMEQNETAKELYRLGFFSPDKAQESILALDMMDFEGIDKVREKVQQGQTLMHISQQLMQENAMLKAALGIAPADGQQGAQQQTAGNMQAGPQTGSSGLASAVSNAQQQRMTGYGQRLAKRSTPDMGSLSGAADPAQGGR